MDKLQQGTKCPRRWLRHQNDMVYHHINIRYSWLRPLPTEPTMHSSPHLDRRSGIVTVALNAISAMHHQGRSQIMASRVSVVRIRIIGFADEAKQRYCLLYSKVVSISPPGMRDLAQLSHNVLFSWAPPKR